MASVLVFGSNLLGLHGGGAAREAFNYHGAKWGVGEGRTGNAYALPTKLDFNETLLLDEIAKHAATFIAHARENPGDTFMLTQVGCGLAGLTKEQVAPLFVGIPDNVMAPAAWHEIIFGRHVADRISFSF